MVKFSLSVQKSNKAFGFFALQTKSHTIPLGFSHFYQGSEVPVQQQQQQQQHQQQEQHQQQKQQQQ